MSEKIRFQQPCFAEKIKFDKKLYCVNTLLHKIGGLTR